MPMKHNRLWARSWTWVALSVVCLWLDYITGPTIQFPITFVLPVLLAAWRRRVAWAIGLAVILPLVRFGFVFLWDEIPWSIGVSILNMFIRIGVLTLVALLALRVMSQFHQLCERVQILEGLVPICMKCKMIRDEHDVWQPLESYIAMHSGVVFSHLRCPDCRGSGMARHTPEFDAANLHDARI